MKINDKAITEQLEAIRRQVGGERAAFTPRPFPDKQDRDLKTPEAVEALFHASGLLIDAGRPVFAYIRDHTVRQYSDDPNSRNRVHFTVCEKLQEMKNSGRFARYRLTHRDGDAYLVDVSEGWGRSRELDGQTLYPCKYCLANVGYHCYSKDMRAREKDEIVLTFEAKEAYRLLWQHFDAFRQSVSSMTSSLVPTGYPKGWNETSARFRKLQNYTCQKCGVNLTRHRNLTDTHHIDGDKPNVRYGNLSCLCKICHSEEPSHSHYKISRYVRDVINRERRRQGIDVS